MSIWKAWDDLAFAIRSSLLTGSVKRYNWELWFYSRTFGYTQAVHGSSKSDGRKRHEVCLFYIKKCTVHARTINSKWSFKTCFLLDSSCYFSVNSTLLFLSLKLVIQRFLKELVYIFRRRKIQWLLHIARRPQVVGKIATGKTFPKLLFRSNSYVRSTAWISVQAVTVWNI